MFEEQVNSLIFYFQNCPVGKRLPVINLTAQIEGETANTIIWIPVGSHNGYFTCRIEFSGSHGSANPCIAASDNEDVGHKIFLLHTSGGYRI
jgi:hypothetical protein